MTNTLYKAISQYHITFMPNSTSPLTEKQLKQIVRSQRSWNKITSDIITRNELALLEFVSHDSCDDSLVQPLDVAIIAAKKCQKAWHFFLEE